MTIRILLFLFVFSAGCGPDHTSTYRDEADASIILGEELRSPDIPTGNDTLTAFDFMPSSGCPGGLGCYCGQGAPCSVGVCLGNVCTIACGGACPPGWICEFTGQGHDRVMACIPQSVDTSLEVVEDVVASQQDAVVESTDIAISVDEITLESEVDIEVPPEVQLAEPPCPDQFIEVPLDGMPVCAPDLPVWGIRPIKPEPSWFVDNGDGTVTDIDTGMTWEMGHASNKHKQAAFDYCDNLIKGGFSDWRMPTAAELVTLLDYSAVTVNWEGSLFVAPFSSGKDYGSYLTLSAFSNKNYPYWVLEPVQGRLTYGPNNGYNVRCVRHKAWDLPPTPRMVVKYLTWVDQVTGLEWSKDVIGPGISSNLNECDSGSGWRVPNIIELHSLTNRQTAKFPPVSDNTPKASPWGTGIIPFLSTTIVYDANGAAALFYGVDFQNGFTVMYGKDVSSPYGGGKLIDWISSGYLRCVK